MNEMPKEGELAPDFELRDDGGATHRLDDRRGHYTVVYFYPEDDTPGCRRSARSTVCRSHFSPIPNTESPICTAPGARR